MDITLKEILIQVQQEMQEEGIEMSLQEVGAIFDSQINGTILGFKKHVQVRLPVFGRFVQTYGVEFGNAVNALKDEYVGRTVTEYNEAARQLKIKNKQLVKDRKNKVERLTIDELLKIESTSKLRNVYDKL